MLGYPIVFLSILDKIEIMLFFVGGHGPDVGFGATFSRHGADETNPPGFCGIYPGGYSF